MTITKTYCLIMPELDIVYSDYKIDLFKKTVEEKVPKNSFVLTFNPTPFNEHTNYAPILTAVGLVEEKNKKTIEAIKELLDNKSIVYKEYESHLLNEDAIRYVATPL